MKRYLIFVFMCLLSFTSVAQESTLTNQNKEKVYVFTYNDAKASGINGKNVETKGKLGFYFNKDALYAAVSFNSNGQSYVVTDLRQYYYSNSRTLRLNKNNNEVFWVNVEMNDGNDKSIMVTLHDDNKKIHASLNCENEQLNKQLKNWLSRCYPRTNQKDDAVAKAFKDFLGMSDSKVAPTQSQNVVNAPEAKVEKTWLEFNVKQGGQMGLKVHCRITINGHRGHDISAIAYLYEEKKNRWRGGNGSFCANDGQACASNKGTVNHDQGHFNDLVIFWPYDQMQMAPGKHDYFIKVDIWSPWQNKFLCFGDYVSFQGTGTMSNPWQMEQWEADEKPVFNGNMVVRTTRFDCTACGKSGICSLCRGTGRSNLFPVYSCVSCSGLRRCSFCGGDGIQEYTTNYLPLNYMASGYLRLYYDTYQVNQGDSRYCGSGARLIIYDDRAVLNVAGRTYTLYYKSIGGFKGGIQQFYRYSLKDVNDNIGWSFGPMQMSIPDTQGVGMVFLFNEKGSDNYNAFENKIQVFKLAEQLQY